jgi:AcrR family transcriptional regulator
MSGKAVENKRIKKEKLLEAAYSLFSRFDFHDVSIADLASHAGVAKGTFYLFFKDKNELRDAVIQKECETISMQACAELQKNDIRNFLDAVVFMINQILTLLEQSPIMLNYLLHSVSLSSFNKLVKRIMDGEDNSDSNLYSTFLDLARQSGYTYENPHIVFFMVVELTASICYSAAVENIPGTLEECRPVLFESVRAILEGNRKAENAS